MLSETDTLFSISRSRSCIWYRAVVRGKLSGVLVEQEPEVKG